jgi:CubicO group peptidase (beta-lactamase class C family)
MRPALARLAIAALPCAVANFRAAASESFPVIPEVQAAVQKSLDDHEVAGAVTLVESGDRILHFDAAGFADLAGRPMRRDTLFWIASMTKPITATAVLMLQDEHKLSLDDAVARYIPAFAELKTPSGKPANLTLRQLLTHTSGLEEGDPAAVRRARTLADLIPRYLVGPTLFEPGSRWKYCQSGMNTAARIVEIVSGQSFPDFLSERLFRPLGMKDTTFYVPPEQMRRLASVYQHNPTTGRLEPTQIGPLYPDNRDRAPHGNDGLYTTAADYARFCQMLLRGGEEDGQRCLWPETVRLMDTIQTGDLITGFPANGDYGWGIGVCIVRHPRGVSAMLSPGAFGHGGVSGTQAWIDPARGIAYILMVQGAHFPNNSDHTEIRKNFQQAAETALFETPR